MTLSVKIILTAAVVLSTGVLACVDNPPDRPMPVFKSIDSTPIKCEETCGIRFPDGECKVDMNCLLRSLLFTDTLYVSAFASVEEGVNKYEEKEEQQQTDTTSSSCQGKCLFTDKEDNCRLDLICTLNRDFEGTLRLLRKLKFDAETAILLSLSASSKATIGDAPGRVCNEYVKEAPVEGNCVKISNCSVSGSCRGPTINKKEEEEIPIIPGMAARPDPRVTGSPLYDCPGKCEIRDSDGICIIDYDCARRDP